jgi:hypothetical protein
VLNLAKIIQCHFPLIQCHFLSFSDNINLKYFNEFNGPLNDQTSETMVIRYEGQYCLWIARHPTGANAEWIEQMAKYEEYPGCRIRRDSMYCRRNFSFFSNLFTS